MPWRLVCASGLCQSEPANVPAPSRTQEFYGITLEALAEAKNERLWFKTQLKLCSLWLKLREFSRATKLLKELHRRGARGCAKG